MPKSKNKTAIRSILEAEQPGGVAGQDTIAIEVNPGEPGGVDTNRVTLSAGDAGVIDTERVGCAQNVRTEI